MGQRQDRKAVGLAKRGRTPNRQGPQPLAILSADGFDPDGDGREKPVRPKVFDGDPNTAWMSEGYKTPNLGGLKPGVGVIVDLGPNVTPKHVDLTLGAPASLEITSRRIVR